MIDDGKLVRLEQRVSDLEKKVAEQDSVRLAYQASTDRMLARVVADVITIRETLEKRSATGL